LTRKKRVVSLHPLSERDRKAEDFDKGRKEFFWQKVGKKVVGNKKLPYLCSPLLREGKEVEAEAFDSSFDNTGLIR